MTTLALAPVASLAAVRGGGDGDRWGRSSSDGERAARPPPALPRRTRRRWARPCRRRVPRRESSTRASSPSPSSRSASSGGRPLGLVVARLRAPRAWPPSGFVLLAVAYGDSRLASHLLLGRLELLRASKAGARPGVPRDRRRRCAAAVADPRVAVEYGTIHEKAGSIRMYETLPLFSGRSTLEGVYNQASVSTHPVYYLASELFASSPNPFSKRTYSAFDPESALPRLRLFAVGDVVTVSSRLVRVPGGPEGRDPVARIPPYRVFHLAGGRRWLRRAPAVRARVVARPPGWADRAYRWFSSKPLHDAHPRLHRRPALQDDASRTSGPAPPHVPLPDGGRGDVAREGRRDRDHDEPARASVAGEGLLPPAMARRRSGRSLALRRPRSMLVVPHEVKSRLVYAGRDGARTISASPSPALDARPRDRATSRVSKAPSAPREPVPVIVPDKSPLKWGGVIPGLILVLAGRRPLPSDHEARPRPAPDARRAGLESLRRGPVRGRGGVRPARPGPRETSSSLRAELLCLRGESLLRAGHAREAVFAFQEVVDTAATSPYIAQALYWGARAREATGDTLGAAADRQRLLRDQPHTSWAQRLKSEGRIRTGQGSQ